GSHPGAARGPMALARCEIGSATLLQVLLGLVADAGATGGADGTTDDSTRRAGDGPTDHRARGTAAQRTCAGPGLVVAFGGLTSDRATDGPDSATDDGTRRATDRGSDGCPGPGAPARPQRLGAL